MAHCNQLQDIITLNRLTSQRKPAKGRDQACSIMLQLAEIMPSYYLFCLTISSSFLAKWRIWLNGLFALSTYSLSVLKVNSLRQASDPNA